MRAPALNWEVFVRGSILSMGCFALVFMLFLNSACEHKFSPHNSLFESNNDSALRSLTVAERSADFDQLLTAFKTNYGPYQYKERTLGINIENKWVELRDKAIAAKTDEEFAGYIMQFGALMRDGHVQVSLENSASGIARYRIPLTVQNVEGKVLVVNIKEDYSKDVGIERGDEILQVDGEAPLSYLPTIVKYRSAATDLSNAQYVAYLFLRPSYMTDLIPTKPMAHVRFVKADGSLHEVDLIWSAEKYSDKIQDMVKSETSKFPGLSRQLDLRVSFANDLNSIVDNGRFEMGQTNPIFLTEQVKEKYKFAQVYPTDETRKKFGLEDKEKPAIYASLYKFQGKTILLVRSATYHPEDFKPAVYMKAYQALLSDFNDLADVLVIDQTHNPGGSYCADFYNIFAKDDDVQGVQRMRSDRKWINDLQINWPNEEQVDDPYGATVERAWSLIVEKSYDQGDFLSAPIPLFTGSVKAEKKKFNWTKPMLVLIDELAGSCGDIFPMLVKANHRATLFGQTTMGLGGNVEEVVQLQNSRVHVRMTRGLFFPYKNDVKEEDKDYVENNGVSPDVSYAHTVEDFRGGFVNYVKLFSEKALEQIK